MTILSIKERMEIFLDTLQQCGMHLLEMDDEDIGYHIFEEFDVGAGSFLHENTLLALMEAGFISEKIANQCTELRYKFFALEDTELWNVDAVKTSKEWDEIMRLSDEIKSLLAPSI